MQKVTFYVQYIKFILQQFSNFLYQAVTRYEKFNFSLMLCHGKNSVILCNNKLNFLKLIKKFLISLNQFSLWVASCEN